MYVDGNNSLGLRPKYISFTPCVRNIFSSCVICALHDFVKDFQFHNCLSNTKYNISTFLPALNFQASWPYGLHSPYVPRSALSGFRLTANYTYMTPLFGSPSCDLFHFLLHSLLRFSAVWCTLLTSVLHFGWCPLRLGPPAQDSTL